LNVGKVLLLAKQTRVQRRKTRGAGKEVTQKLHEETWNGVSNLVGSVCNCKAMACCVRKFQMFME